MRRPRFIEWPTLIVALLTYGGWGAVTLAAANHPWVTMPLGAFLIAWHGSLQHETIHGHPTRSRVFNTLLGSLPLALWIPYGIYRDLHLAHHRTSSLTDPVDDPESFYVTADEWQRAGALRRAILRANTTLVGRLTLGPLVCVLGFFGTELRRVLKGDTRHVRAWLLHAIGVAVMLAWLELVCKLSLAQYLVMFVYPGIALTLLRSFAEHRPAPTNAHGIGIVEAGPITSLVFLNNNLHSVHHESPALPWYELPARYWPRRSEVLARNGGFVFVGYGAVFARFAFRAKDAPIHPHASPSPDSATSLVAAG
ncbi:MAG TPA: fatty acid desaturase [Labilithrix sp.]|nr:fatty acid desaturase [Labilithrix sp.]